MNQNRVKILIVILIIILTSRILYSSSGIKFEYFYYKYKKFDKYHFFIDFLEINEVRNLFELNHFQDAEFGRRVIRFYDIYKGDFNFKSFTIESNNVNRKFIFDDKMNISKVISKDLSNYSVINYNFSYIYKDSTLKEFSCYKKNIGIGESEIKLFNLKYDYENNKLRNVILTDYVNNIVSKFSIKVENSFTIILIKCYENLNPDDVLTKNFESINYKYYLKDDNIKVISEIEKSIWCNEIHDMFIFNSDGINKVYKVYISGGFNKVYKIEYEKNILKKYGYQEFIIIDSYPKDLNKTSKIDDSDIGKFYIKLNENKLPELFIYKAFKDNKHYETKISYIYNK